MTTPELNINDSLLNSHQGAILGALGGLGDKLKGFLTEPAKNLGTVVSRLGVGAAAIAIVAMAGLTAPGQAQAQSWANASPWATAGNINDAFQQQRQTDFANQATRVIAEQRGLSSKDQNLASLAALGAGAFTSGSKAPIAAAVVGAGAAMLIPNSNQPSGQQIVYTGGQQGQSNGQWANASPWGSNGGGNQQQNGAQNAATQQAYNAYVQYSEPQYQVALRANMEGNMQARRDAIVSFGNAWNAASQTGLPLSKIPQEVAKFQQMQSMDSQALHAGLAGVRTTAQVQPQYNQGFSR